MVVSLFLCKNSVVPIHKGTGEARTTGLTDSPVELLE